MQVFNLADGLMFVETFSENLWPLQPSHSIIPVWHNLIPRTCSRVPLEKNSHPPLTQTFPDPHRMFPPTHANIFTPYGNVLIPSRNLQTFQSLGRTSWSQRSPKQSGAPPNRVSELYHWSRSVLLLTEVRLMSQAETETGSPAGSA